MVNKKKNHTYRVDYENEFDIEGQKNGHSLAAACRESLFFPGPR